jgi:hypothetical protein
MDALINKELLNVTTSTMSGHDHTMSLKYRKKRNNYIIYKCDDEKRAVKGKICKDEHPIRLFKMADQ